MTTTEAPTRIMSVKQQQKTLSTFNEAKPKSIRKQSLLSSSNEFSSKSRVTNLQDANNSHNKIVRVVRLRQNEAANSKLGFSLRGGKF